MRTPVPDLLTNCDDMNGSLSGSAGYSWSAMWGDTGREFDPMCFGLAEKIVQTRVPNDIALGDLHYCKRARFMQNDSKGPQRAYRYSVIECGEAVSAIVEEDHSPSASSAESFYVRTVTDGDGDCRYFVVGGIIGNVRKDDVWVICKELLAHNSAYSCKDSTRKFIKLDVGCRRVALVHECGIQCVRQDGRAAPQHHETCLECGVYHVLDRKKGFPPFQG